MSEPTPNTTTASPDAHRPHAVILFTSAIASVAFMAMHPTSRSHDVSEFVAEAASGMRGVGPVHGVLVSLAIVNALGFLGLGDVLEWRRPWVRAATLALATGTACGVAAGLINGFVVPGVARMFADVGPEAIESLRPVLALCKAANRVCAQADVIGLSIASLTWGFLLAHERGWWRGAGWVGLACGAGPLVMLAIGRLPMTVHGFGAFVACQAVWALAAGAALWRAPRNRPDKAPELE